MNEQGTTVSASRRPLRSITAILNGIVIVFLLSLGTDQVFHVLQVYPPWDQPMNETSDNLLALSYRLIYGILGGYATARLAPYAPMRHVLIFGAVGTVLSILGAIGAISMEAGPSWLPVALVLTALPCAWVGAELAGRGRRRR